MYSYYLLLVTNNTPETLRSGVKVYANLPNSGQYTSDCFTATPVVINNIESKINNEINTITYSQKKSVELKKMD